jgi:hypothetical protein
LLNLFLFSSGQRSLDNAWAVKMLSGSSTAQTDNDLRAILGQTLPEFRKNCIILGFTAAAASVLKTWRESLPGDLGLSNNPISKNPDFTGHDRPFH